MIRSIKIIILSVVITVIAACSYKPILIEKNYAFKIQKISLNGNKEINSVIKNKLNFIRKDEENENKKNYLVSIDSIKEKNILSKDSKGDPLKFEMIITTTFQIYEKEKLLTERKIVKKNIYNNKSDKFKLEQSEKIIIKNLSEKISENIISVITNLNDN